MEGFILDTIRQIVIGKLYMMPAILIAFTFHEYAHAVVADKLGDKTPKFQGRITLNPLEHIDLLGFIMIVFVGFGWAKPVETNPNAYKNYYKDDFKVSIAGPLANLLVAFIFSFITVAIYKFLPMDQAVVSIVFTMAQYIVSINCMFFLFNLIPIPGLDGFHILRDLSPKTFYNIGESLYRYQMLILIAIIIPVFGNKSLADFIILYPANAIANLFLKIALLI